MRLKHFLLLLFSLMIPISLTNATPQPPIKLIFTTPSEDAVGATRTLIKKFNATHPGIVVLHRPLSSSSDGCHNFYVTSFMSKEKNFDVLAADVIWTAEFAAALWVEPLDSYLSPQTKASFIPSVLKTCNYQARLWAIPWFTDTGLLYYRQDLLAKPPQTWAELIKLSEREIQKGTVPYGYIFQGNQYEGLICNILECIWNNGGEITQGNELKLDSPRTIAGVNLLANLIKNKITPSAVTSFQEEDARLFFQDGQALFLRSWPNVWATLNNPTSKLRGKVGIAPLPAGSVGQQGIGCLGGWNLMLNHASTKKKAAWEFISFMTNATQQRSNAIIAGRLPTSNRLYHDRLVLKANPHYPSLLPLISRARPRPSSTVYPALSEVMQEYFHAVLTGQMSTTSALAKATAALKEIKER